MGHEGGRCTKGQVHLAAQQVLQGRARALVRHVHHLNAGSLLQLNAGDVLQRSIARRGVVELHGVGLGIRHQLLHGVGRQITTHHHDLWGRQHIGHGHKVGQLPAGLAQMGRDHMKARVLHQQVVAIGLSALDLCGCNVAVATALVFHHDGLAQHGAQCLRSHAGGQIGGATSGSGHHHVDGLAGVARLR